MATGGPGEIYMNLVQRQLDSKFADLDRDLDHRFEEFNRRFTNMESSITNIQEKPKTVFKTYITPVIVSVITAIALAYLVRHGVAS